MNDQVVIHTQKKVFNANIKLFCGIILLQRVSITEVLYGTKRPDTKLKIKVLDF